MAIGKLVNSCNRRNDSLLFSKNHNKTTSSLENLPVTSVHYTHSNIIMFSDAIGKGLGMLMKTQITRNIHLATCNLYANSSCNMILEKTITATFDTNTSLMIFSGNRGGVNKKTFAKYFELLLELNANKMVLLHWQLAKGCLSMKKVLELIETFKYNLFEHFIFNVISQINGRFYNQFHLMDTHRIVYDIAFSTTDSYYLPYYFKRQIACVSLLYYFRITAKNLAILAAPIKHHLCRM